MRKLFFLCFVVPFCLVYIVNECPAVDSASETVHKLEELEENPAFTYHIVLPPQYNPAQKYPLLISLHGAGEKGDRMVRYWKKSAAAHDMILCCPNSTSYGWQQDDMLSVLKMSEHVLRDYPVERGKVLLSGISAGGVITYLLGFTVPVMYPFINPMSAAFNEQFLPYIQKAEKIPVYITHGMKDEMIPPDKGGKAMASTLKENGFDVTYAERPNDGHEVPEGEQEKILNWFELKYALQQTRIK